MTKTVLETALNEEITEHLGDAKNDPAGVGSDHIGNGTPAQTVLPEHSGPAEIDVPRDRDGTVAPQIVRKPALNGFSITFADRFPAAETY